MPDPTAQEIAANISNELFPEPNSSNEGKPDGGEGGESLIDGQNSGNEDQNTPAQTQNQTPPITQPQGFQGKPLPKSWKKEMQPIWEKLDPQVHEYVYEREGNVMRGLQQYQTGHERWNEVIHPFKQVIEQHPDVNPVQLLQNLMHNHLQLLSSPAEKKVALVRQLAESYNIDLNSLVGGSDQTPQQPNAELLALRREVQELRQGFQSREARAYEEAVDKELKTVQEFFADPKNEFAEELGDDILRLIKTGAVDSLAAAYETACWSNPTVREKMLAKQREAAAGEQLNKRKPLNVDDSGSARVNKKPISWQEDVDSIVKKHFPTH